VVANVGHAIVTGARFDGSDGSDGFDGSKVARELSDCLDQLEKHFRKYVFLIQPDDYKKLAVWAFHTHVADVTFTSPRLLLESPLPGSGKTTVLEHLNLLCLNAYQMAGAPTPALIGRLLDTGIHTFLLDEAHNIIDPKNPKNAELIAAVNGGYKYGAKRPVLIPGKGGTWEAANMSVYGPMAISGNNPQLADDTRERCITIRLLKDTRERVTESNWELIEPDTLDLAEYVATTAELAREAIRACQPRLPDGCKNRDRERWKPLARIATVAGRKWADDMREIITRELERAKVENESAGANVPPAIQLIVDLEKLFTPETNFLPTAVILAALNTEHPDRWGRLGPLGKDLTPQRMGRMLVRGFGITAGKDSDTRGYYVGPFIAAWEALGIREPSKPSEPSEPSAAEPTDTGPL
jgi:hypothetical protein